VRLVVGLGLAACGFLSTLSPRAVEPPAIGLGHVPVAVADLNRAASDFERLGFALKVGRVHDDGIVNRHAKFIDGTEVELITAPAATDALTGYYRRFLADGDGAAFLSLYPESMDDAEQRLAAAGLPVHRGEGVLDFPYGHALGYVFFAGLNQSPTDRPEHFAHANSAFRLDGVWLEGQLLAAEAQLFAALGLKAGPCLDDPAPTSSCVPLAHHQWIHLAKTPAEVGRRIAGLTVSVRSLTIVKDRLGRERIEFRQSRSGGWSSLVVNGSMAHGVRLEFREYSQAGRR
jgi:hypothetical protein